MWCKTLLLVEANIIQLRSRRGVAAVVVLAELVVLVVLVAAVLAELVVLVILVAAAVLVRLAEMALLERHGQEN